MSILLLIVLIAVALFGLVFLIKALFKETYGRRFEKVKSDIAKEYLSRLLPGREELFGKASLEKAKELEKA